MITKISSETLVVLVFGLWIVAGLCIDNAHALRCYTDAEATQITRCKESEGFRTCFTKYNDSKAWEGIEGQVTGRGCSTKDKVFYKECETHSYGEQVEKMCFCSYFLCNKAGWSSTNPNFLLIIGATMFCVLLNSCHYTTCKSSSSYGSGITITSSSTTTTRLNNPPSTTTSLESSCDKATQSPPHTSHGGHSISQHTNTVEQQSFQPQLMPERLKKRHRTFRTSKADYYSTGEATIS